MITSKEQLEKCKKISDSMGALTFGCNVSTFVTALTMPGTFAYLIPVGLNVGCIGVRSYLTKEIANYDENGYISEINKIYSDIVDDTIKLSKDLDNKELLEHYTLLKALYRNGYMSYNSGARTISKVEDEIRMLGAMSLNGHGVCRNTSVLTKDYLSRLGYKSQVLVGRTEYDLEFAAQRIAEMYIEQARALGFNINEEDIDGRVAEIKELLIASRDERTSFANPEVEENGIEPEKSMFGNHAITKSNDKDNSYYLDLSLDTFYAPYNDTFVSYDGETFDVCKINNMYSKRLFKTKPIKDKKVLDLAKTRSLVLSSDRKIVENLDMLEQFKKEHCDQLERAEEIYRLKRVK